MPESVIHGTRSFPTFGRFLFDNHKKYDKISRYIYYQTDEYGGIAYGQI